MFMGGILLFAAAIVWGMTLMMSPHGSSVAEGTDHVRTVVANYIRNSAIMTLVLCALAGWMLFPLRRPRAPRRDWAVGVMLAILVATSVYQLIWLQTSVLN
jgi:hypothetical protein